MPAFPQDPFQRNEGDDGKGDEERVVEKTRGPFLQPLAGQRRDGFCHRSEAIEGHVAPARKPRDFLEKRSISCEIFRLGVSVELDHEGGLSPVLPGVVAGEPRSLDGDLAVHEGPSFAVSSRSREQSGELEFLENAPIPSSTLWDELEGESYAPALGRRGRLGLHRDDRVDSGSFERFARRFFHRGIHFDVRGEPVHEAIRSEADVSVGCGETAGDGPPDHTSPEPLIETVACLHLINRRQYLADPELLRDAYRFSERLFAKLQAFRASLKDRKGQRVREESAFYVANDEGELPF